MCFLCFSALCESWGYSIGRGSYSGVKIKSNAPGRGFMAIGFYIKLCSEYSFDDALEGNICELFDKVSASCEHRCKTIHRIFAAFRKNCFLKTGFENYSVRWSDIFSTSTRCLYCRCFPASKRRHTNQTAQSRFCIIF